LPKLKELIPSYGVSLIDDADFTRKIRAETARVLKVDDVNSAHKATPSPVRAAVGN
jgi:malate dehydrogenase (quinone)